MLPLDLLNESFNHNIADGWVELGPDNLLRVELFAKTIKQLKLRPGDYVKLKVLTSAEIKEAGSAE